MPKAAPFPAHYPKLAELWKKEVYDLAEIIDPLMDKGGADYESMCMGWMLAHGHTPEECSGFYDYLIRVGMF